MSTVGTSQETAIATLPPNLDAAKDREKWKLVSPPEKKKQSPEHSQVLDETKTELLLAPEEHLPNSENPPRPSDRAPQEAIEEEVGEQQGVQQTPSRRGIWNWAKASTGRLNIIGRLPHPEWRGPVSTESSGVVTNGVMNGGAVYGAHDDFSIPSTTATEPDNMEQQREAAAAKLEVFGPDVQTMSPHFAQTKGSSDDLISAASSTASTPAPARNDSPPTTPDTPTPQQRVKGLPADARKELTDQKSPTPQQRDAGRPLEAQGPSAKDTPKAAATTDCEDATPTKEKPRLRPTPSYAREKHSRECGCVRDNSNAPAKTKEPTKTTTTPRSITKYKVALAPNLLSPARTGTGTSWFRPFFCSDWIWLSRDTLTVQRQNELYERKTKNRIYIVNLTKQGIYTTNLQNRIYINTHILPNIFPTIFHPT
jgi:hypothetical protein